MKKTLLLPLLAVFIISGSAFAVPDLQLFIAGATYDNVTDTWVTHSSTFDLYVIGANQVMSNVQVSMALNLDQSVDPNGTASIGVNGTLYDSWIYGTPNFLPTHDIFPAWYTTFNAGNFGFIGRVGDVAPPYNYDPSAMGYLSTGNAWGQYKRYSISLSGIDYTHFDSYFYYNNSFGSSGHTKIKFAPFSHDAESSNNVVPEPTTLALFGIGTLGMGLVRKFRK
ncbi:conserved exported hypothetical protein [Candidatus Zixiibacteriota bacterium]|nr:conserved exported hypothetical protein [candidate division Zixibacteria bacterium]